MAFLCPSGGRWWLPATSWPAGLWSQCILWKSYSQVKEEKATVTTIGFLKTKNKRTEGQINLGVLVARFMGSGALKGTYNHLPQVPQNTGQGGPSASQSIPGTQDSELRAGCERGILLHTPRILARSAFSQWEGASRLQEGVSLANENKWSAIPLKTRVCSWLWRYLWKMYYHFQLIS